MLKNYSPPKSYFFFNFGAVSGLCLAFCPGINDSLAELKSEKRNGQCKMQMTKKMARKSIMQLKTFKKSDTVMSYFIF